MDIEATKKHTQIELQEINRVILTDIEVHCIPDIEKHLTALKENLTEANFYKLQVAVCRAADNHQSTCKVRRALETRLECLDELSKNN
jgi:hypothetical protein